MITRALILAVGLVALLAPPAAPPYGPNPTNPPAPNPPLTTAPATTVPGTTTPADCDIELNDDFYTTPINTLLAVGVPGVEVNDLICPSPQAVFSTSSPSNGTLTNFDGGPGSFDYQPDPGFTGTDQFTYVVESTRARAGGGKAIIRGEATVFIEVVGGSVTTIDGGVGGNDTSQGGPGGQTGGGNLVRTGSNTGPLLRIGGALVVMGALLTLTMSKRRTRGSATS